MSYSVSNEEMKRIAQELGLEIRFNSLTPGVHNLTSGETKPLSEYFDEYFDYHFLENEVKIKKLSHLKAKIVHPKEIKISSGEFSFPTNDSNDLPKIA